MTLLLLLACTGPAPGDDTPHSGAPDDTAHTGDVDDTAPEDTELRPCAPGASLSFPDLSVPGEMIELSVQIPDTVEGGPFTYEWHVESGSLYGGDTPNPTWSLPTDVARNGLSLIDFMVTIRGDHCEPEIIDDELYVDWPESRRTIVVYNPAVDGSELVARAYADFRDIPDAQLCSVKTTDDTEIAAAEWARFAQDVQSCIDGQGDHIMYLVPVWGVPYKVSGLVHDIGYPENIVTVSLDALLVHGIDAADAENANWSAYYQDGDSMRGEYDPWLPFGDLRRTMPTNDHLYLVARIDGAGQDAAVALIDRTAAAEALAAKGGLAGTVYVDGRFGDDGPATDDFGTYESGDWNMVGTREVFEAAALYPVVWDGNEAEFGTEPAPLTAPDALYYAGWYSFWHYNDVFTWNVGAIGAHLDSCSACDIRGNGTWAATALERGITATFGAVNEPYVAGMPEYDQFFLYLLQGANFAEAGYESTRIDHWMMVWVGDPLYRPYPGGVVE